MLKKAMLLFVALGITILGYSQIWTNKNVSYRISKVSDGVYSIMGTGGIHYLYRRTEKKNDPEFNAKVQSWLDQVSLYKGSKVMYGEHGKRYRNAGGERVLDGFVYLLWYDDIHMGLSVIYMSYDPKANKVMNDLVNPSSFTTYHVY
jgi:arginyl-tRNA--protein-N-Asp/Glu arginylyltransferase